MLNEYEMHKPIKILQLFFSYYIFKIELQAHDLISFFLYTLNYF